MTLPDTEAFAPFAERMRALGMPDVALRSFRRSYEALCKPSGARLAESDIEPVTSVPSLDELGDLSEVGLAARGRCCIVKLNGGLGTSMGLEIPKSLVELRDGLTFLDVIAEQSLALADGGGTPMPLVLMNSFRTAAPTAAHLARRAERGGRHLEVLDFEQHRVPKVDAETLAPVDWPESPELAWCPPGHGDLYAALLSSGVLDRLEGRGIRYAFVSNIDNLGASFEPAILGLMVDRALPFLMEVTARREVDRKGGHLARFPDGRLGLREVAQCPEEDLPRFQDIELHRFFNTNNLWIDLVRLRELLERHAGALPLPVIRNRKTVDPTRPDSPAVFQLETAMGAALALFDGAQAVEVPRRRFAAVKTCADLLAVSSDAYVLTPEWHVQLAAERERPPVIDLDDRYYKRFPDFRARFPEGPPSLRDCERLGVEGDVRFEREVVVKGSVSVSAPRDGAGRIERGRVLEDARVTASAR